MNEDEQVIWRQPVSFLDFVLGFLIAPNQRRVEFVPKADPLKFYIRERVASPSQDLGEIRDANKERVNRSLSNYASNNFLLSTSNIRPDLNGRYNPGLGLFAGDLTVLALSMGFDPFNASNYYKVATQIPIFRNWGFTRLLADELNNEVRVAGELGKNVGSFPKTLFVFPLFRNVTRTVQDNGKIRLSLPSHTDTNPRQFVLEPLGNNKFYVHMRTWDGDHIPANLSNEDKLALFQALYDELPEGAEILFPKSGPGYYGTRGTVAGLLRLSRDSRFSPGTKGTLLYVDKDGTIKTYEGTSFIKKSVLEPKTSLRFFERPSNLTSAEKLGIPRGERNQPYNPKQISEYVLGDEAVKMFKEYGGEPIPKNSINGEQLRKYVAEARERYGLVGNTNITDEEIALALYKHSKELGGNTAAVNALGEPQLLFRGDTKRYTELKERMSPEELAKAGGTMDNSLGTLFLGELPGTAGKHTRGLERYLVTGRDYMGQKRLEGSGTGSRAIMPDGTFATEWGNMINMFPDGSYPLVTYNTRVGPNTYYKLPSNISESGVNDINAFVVRTPAVRDASKEISVLKDDIMVKGGPEVEYHGPIRREVLDKDGFPLLEDENGNVVANGLAGSSDRLAMSLHYRYVLDDAKSKKLGLLKSEGETDGTPGNYLRDEHDDYTYFALPNFNIQGAKHLLPYDLRIPRNWNDRNIYRGLIPIGGGYTLYNLLNNLNNPILKFKNRYK